MPKVKDFDCVEMKNRIQAELLEHYRGMTDEEIRPESFIHFPSTTVSTNNGVPT